ncbi:MAG TPA: S1 family peptidase [Natronosporangium sp.]
MRSIEGRTGRRLVGGFATLLVAATLTAAGPVPAQAQGLSTPPDRSAELALGEATLRQALERDLGLSGSALDEYLAAAAEATELDARLREQLGDEYAGSWFDRSSGSLTVAVTDRRAARLASSAGARTTVVDRSEQELTAITGELDALAKQDPAELSDVFSWAVEAQTNQVVVTVRAGAAEALTESLREAHGDAIRIEESEYQPQLAQAYPWLDGGIPYNGCSTGFNMRNPSTGARYFLTAGHCGVAGNGATAGNGVFIGTFTASFFPTFDDALVQVTNTGYWLQGPFVFSWPGFIVVSSSYTDGPVGTPVCKSGRTTGWTCGTITGKNETVNYPQGTVFGLTRHNACVEQGDSGGSNVNVAGNHPEGVTSGAQLLAGLCLGKFPLMSSVSWYSPAADSVPYYNAVYGAQLW